MRGIFVLFNVIEFISKSCEVLCFHDLVDVVWLISWFSIWVCLWEFCWIISVSPMLLDFTGFVYMRFSVFLQMFWSAWVVLRQVNIGSNIKISVLSVSNTNNLMSSRPNAWHWIIHDSDTLLKALSKNHRRFISRKSIWWHFISKYYLLIFN